MNILNCCYNNDKVHEGPPIKRHKTKKKFSETDVKVDKVKDSIEINVVNMSAINDLFKETSVEKN